MCFSPHGRPDSAKIVPHSHDKHGYVCINGDHHEAERIRLQGDGSQNAYRLHRLVLWQHPIIMVSTTVQKVIVSLFDSKIVMYGKVR